MSKILYHEDTCIGKADEWGQFFPLGKKCKGKIVNRVFAPRWVVEAWAQGLEIFVESITLHKNDKGRYYAVVKGKTALNKVETQKVELRKETFYLIDVYTSGEERVKSSYGVYNNWRKAPEWVKSHPSFEEEVRKYRLNRVLYGRYDPNIKTYHPTGPIEIKKKGLRLLDGLSSIEVQTVLECDGWYLSHSIKDGKIVKEKIETTVREYGERQIVPIEYLFDVQRIDMETETLEETWRSADYESPDGRSTRYDEFDYLNVYKVTKVILTSKVDWLDSLERIQRKEIFSLRIR